MKKRILFTVASLLFVVAQSFATSTPTVYTDEAAFKAALASSYYLDEFDDMTDGTQSWLLTRTSGSYKYTITDDLSVNYGLYEYTGRLSHGNNAGTFIFTNCGKSINAFGGYFYNTDDTESFATGDVSITIGSFVYTFSPSSITSFIGFISSDTIHTVKVKGLTSGLFPVVDHVYVGDTLSSTSGLSTDKALSKEVSVYPTLTSELVNVASVEAVENVDVIDYLGKTIITTKAKTINVSSLPSGVYLVKVTTANGVVTKRVIKK